MKKLLLFCFLNLVSPGLRAQTTARLKTLDWVLTQLHQRAMFNGVVLYAERGKVLYQKELGIANHTTGEALKPTSAFNLASVSKQFIAMMIMQLGKKGRLRYDDKVRTYLPTFPYDSITIRHLLTHTSGLPEYFELAQQYTGPLDTLTNAGMLQLLADHKPALLFRPGDRWTYCNTGYVLLGSIIETVSGTSVRALFDQQIAQPLKLRNTSVYHLKSGPPPANRVYGFQRQNGRLIPDDLIRLDGVIGDGNVYSSAEDLLKWDQSLYTNKLVKASTLREAFTPVRLNNGTTYPYGFGWAIDRTGTVLDHTGSWVGFNTLIVRNTAKRQTLILLSNSHEATGRQIAEAIMAGEPYRVPTTQLISNASVIDGSGLKARRASVRIRDNRIWEIGDLTPFPNETVTDAKGLTLAPGFIDSHSHHDWGLAKAPDALAVVSQGITTLVVGQDGGGQPVDSLRALLKRQPIAVNLATYTGHAALRTGTMGPRSLYRTAKADELAKMKDLLRAELDKGSLGLSTGLEYESAFFSSRDEVLQLAQVAADAGGRYISHIRSEDIALDDAIDEIIQIGRVTKMPVQISHLKIALRNQWGQSPYLLARLERARAEGVNITADCYPYDYWMSTLRVLFPKRDYTNLASAEFAVNQLFDPAQSVLVQFAANPSYAGKTVGEVARLRQRTNAQTLMDLVAEASAFSENAGGSGSVEGIMGKSMDEPDVVNLLSWPHTNIGSDGAMTGHPRGYGAFTRVLGRYVRDQKIMPLETAIYKMTGLTAEHLGFADRGLIAPGYLADLVLFDPATVSDNAAIGNNTALSSGIQLVWVAGQPVYRSGEATGNRPGVFIGRPIR